jgi:hypothetical protein
MSLPFRNSKIAYLASLAKGWGGKIIKLSNREFNRIPWDDSIDDLRDGWFEAPFTYKDSRTGVNFKDKIVVYAGNAPWPNVLHEMGHVFATTDKPDLCSEEDFLGWEYQIGKSIDVAEWLTYNKDYRIELANGKVVDVGKIPKEIAIREMERYLKSAKACGLVTRRGTLKTLRDSCPRCFR